MNPQIKLVECPRDAMQGIELFIPTERKVAYINQLLDVGFHTIDFGSFVSPKHVPQMRDTADVLKKLNLADSTSKLLAIVANKRGIDDASAFDEIQYLGFPFSISEVFQQRNTRQSLDQSLAQVEYLQQMCQSKKKEAVIYISMAFGNPYGEEWHPDIAAKWSERLHLELGVNIIALSDTIGVSRPENIAPLFETCISALPNAEIGAHLHTTPDTWEEKIAAAFEAGCKRFDGALKGFGGCPMAKDDLTGNMPMENIVSYLEAQGEELGIKKEAFHSSLSMASEVMG